MPDLSTSQFGPWKMTPTMNKIFAHMQQNHLGEENSGAVHDIGGITGGYASHAAGERHWEAIQRLHDNGLIKIEDKNPNGGFYDLEPHAWIPNE